MPDNGHDTLCLDVTQTRVLGIRKDPRRDPETFLFTCMRSNWLITYFYVQSSPNDVADKAERITKLEEAVAELGAFNQFSTLKKQD
jgi:hypothetical protein